MQVLLSELLQSKSFQTNITSSSLKYPGQTLLLKSVFENKKTVSRKFFYKMEF